jgi:hypothetical protein
MFAVRHNVFLTSLISVIIIKIDIFTIKISYHILLHHKIYVFNHLENILYRSNGLQIRKSKYFESGEGYPQQQNSFHFSMQYF